MVLIRSARSSDLAQLMRLLEELNGESFTAPGEVREAILDQILNSPDRHLLVAQDGATLVGTADGMVLANLSRDCRPFMLVENVVVAPSHRRAGVGQSLMDELRAIAVGAGCYKIQLVSNKARRDAQDFYLSCGYSASSVGFRQYLVDGLHVLGSPTASSPTASSPTASSPTASSPTESSPAASATADR